MSSAYTFLPTDPVIVDFGQVVLGCAGEEVVSLKNFLSTHISVKLKVSTLWHCPRMINRAPWINAVKANKRPPWIAIVSVLG